MEENEKESEHSSEKIINEGDFDLFSLHVSQSAQWLNQR
jgi:hypothetical protein